MRVLRALSGWIAALVLCVGAFVGANVFLAAGPVSASDSNALWHVVHDLCVVDMRVNHLPAPCVKVDLAARYAVLKDMRGETQLLVIPTDRITGVEDPKVLAPGARNYWQDAWAARDLFEKRIGRPVPRDAIGLTINSLYGRSQNQLHIHLDCIRPGVRRALAEHAGEIRTRWTRLDFDLHGRRYRAMRVEGEDIGDRDPFKLLADADPSARADMSHQTLAVIPMRFLSGPGFVFLADAADPLRFDNGHAEDLQDHDCTVLKG